MQEPHDQEPIEKQKLPGMDDVLETEHSGTVAGIQSVREKMPHPVLSSN